MRSEIIEPITEPKSEIGTLADEYVLYHEKRE